MSASEPSHVERHERPDRRSKTKREKNEGGAASPLQPLLDGHEPWSCHEEGEIDAIETTDAAPSEEEEAELVDAVDADGGDHDSIDEEIWGDL